MNAQQHKAFRKIFNTSMASGTPVGQSVAMAMERSKRAVKPIFRPHNRLYLGQRELLPKLNDFKVGDIGFFENFHISTYSFLRNDIVEFILKYHIMKDCSQDESLRLPVGSCSSELASGAFPQLQRQVLRCSKQSQTISS